MSAPLKPFFGYFGSKAALASRYPPPGNYLTLIEPFAGSAGYALRTPARQVLLCDTNPRICGIWRYLIAARESELVRLPLLGPDSSVEDFAIPPEARDLIGFWLGRCLSSPRLRPSKWRRSGKWPSTFWGENIRARIAAQVGAIRHWRVRCASYETLPIVPATWFIDPPYVGAGHRYRKSASPVVHADLALWCQQREGRVIVCEQLGADWLPFQPLATIRTVGGVSREVVWTKRAPLSQAPHHDDP